MRNDQELIQRLLDHIDRGTTDMGEEDWLEPVENYRCPERFALEQRLMRHLPLPFCPLAALPEVGSYVSHVAGGTPIVAVRAENGAIRAFRNACRHRGKQVAVGSGSSRVFKCAYHGWTYRLDGRLEYIPDEHGFPNLDKSCHGLVPVQVDVRGGLVFITQEEPVSRAVLDTVPEVLPSQLALFAQSEAVMDMNWKLNMEATLEGYHIKHLHPKPSFPTATTISTSSKPAVRTRGWCFRSGASNGCVTWRPRRAKRIVC